jgi:hypothetical protein
MLIGVAPGTSSGDIVVGTDRSIMRVDWQTFEPLAERPPGVRWKTPIQPPNIAAARDPSMVRDPSQATTIRGRPFLSAESVFVPSAWQLVTISLRNGLRTQVYPTDRAWGDDEETGNVLATSEYLIVAGPTRVSAYTDMEMAIRRLDAAIAAAPNDPDPRLRYAEVMFTSGHTDQAMQRLDEAIELLGGRSAMAPGANRERIFSDALKTHLPADWRECLHN